MPSNKFRFIGHVFDTDHQGIAGVRVDAWVGAQRAGRSKQFSAPDNEELTSPQTLENGIFELEFDKSYLDDFALPTRFLVYFKLFLNDELIGNTQASPMLIPGPGDHIVDDIVVDTSAIPSDQYRVAGRVIDAETQQGVSDVEIQAMGKASPTAEGKPLKSTNTNTQGRFEVGFTQADLDALDLPHSLGVYFEVYYDNHLIKSTETAPLQIPGPGSYKQEAIQLDCAPVFRVDGRLTEADGTPIAAATVRAFDIGLQGDETLLGETITNQKGEYLIQYPSASFIDQGKQRPDLDVCAYKWNEEQEEEEKIAWLPNLPLFNARPRETINLVRGAQPYLGPPGFPAAGRCAGAGPARYRSRRAGRGCGALVDRKDGSGRLAGR